MRQWSEVVLGDFKNSAVLDQWQFEGRIFLVFALYHIILSSLIFAVGSGFSEYDHFLRIVEAFSPPGVFLEDLQQRIVGHDIVTYILLSETFFPWFNLIFAIVLVRVISENVLKIDRIQKNRVKRLGGYAFAFIVLLFGWDYYNFWNDRHRGIYSLAGAPDYALLLAELFKQYIFGGMILGISLEMSELWHAHAAHARRST